MAFRQPRILTIPHAKKKYVQELPIEIKTKSILNSVLSEASMEA